MPANADDPDNSTYLPDSLERCDFLNLRDIIVTGDGLAITVYSSFTLAEALLEGVSLPDLETMWRLWVARADASDASGASDASAEGGV